MELRRLVAPWIAAATVFVVLVVAGMAAGSSPSVAASGHEASIAAAPPPAPPTSEPLAAGPSTTMAPVNERAPCNPGDPLLGVPEPDRYSVLESCVIIEGKVSWVQIEHGGMTHVLVETMRGFVDLYALPPLNALDVGRPVFNAPKAGMTIAAVGALVRETESGRQLVLPFESWKEIG